MMDKIYFLEPSEDDENSLLISDEEFEKAFNEQERLLRLLDKPNINPKDE